MLLERRTVRLPVMGEALPAHEGTQLAGIDRHVRERTGQHHLHRGEAAIACERGDVFKHQLVLEDTRIGRFANALGGCTMAASGL